MAASYPQFTLAQSGRCGGLLTISRLAVAEILRLLGEGKSLAEIADTFGVAYKTIANSCSRLKEKLGVERTADLIRLSIERRMK